MIPHRNLLLPPMVDGKLKYLLNDGWWTQLPNYRLTIRSTRGEYSWTAWCIETQNCWFRVCILFLYYALVIPYVQVPIWTCWDQDVFQKGQTVKYHMRLWFHRVGLFFRINKIRRVVNVIMLKSQLPIIPPLSHIIITTKQKHKLQSRKELDIINFWVLGWECKSSEDIFFIYINKKQDILSLFIHGNKSKVIIWWWDTNSPYGNHIF